jgi:hypothetical protein
MMLEEVNQAFGNAKETIVTAYFQARSEGFSAQGAKKLLFSTIKSVGRRTIYLYLPDEAKDKKMQTIAKLSLQTCSEKRNAVKALQMLRGRPRQVNIPNEKYHYPGTVILSNEWANSIHALMSVQSSSFTLTHDGQNVISVERLDSETNAEEESVTGVDIG